MNIFKYIPIKALFALAIIAFSLCIQSTQANQLQTREVRIVGANANPGQTVNLSVELLSQGDENALGFSLNFNPAHLSNPVVTLGSGATGVTLNVNANDAASGRLGVVMAMPVQQSFSAGVRQVLKIEFKLSSSAPQGNSAITFTDQPVVREVSDTKANVLATKFTPGGVEVIGNLSSVSAASFNGTELAPESIVAGFGANLATAVETANSQPLPTSLLGTKVIVKDSVGIEREAPLFFVAPAQINYLMPSGTAAGIATVTATSGDSKISIGNPKVSNVAPGVFSANSDGQGVVAATVLRQKANGEQIYEVASRFDSAQGKFVSVPIDLGPESDQVFLVLYGTGFRFRSALSAVSVKMGGTNAEAIYIGAAPGFSGLDQGNVRIPRSLAMRGEIDLVLIVDEKFSNTTRINIK